MNWKERARGLKRDIPALLLALGRRDTPIAAKVLAAMAVAYALSPIDLVPDFIPVIGLLDDLLILPGLVALTIRLIPAPILAQCRAQAEESQATGGKKWFFALPVLLVWALVLAVVIRAVLRLAGRA